VIAEAVEWAVKNGAAIGTALALPALTEAALWIKAMFMTASTAANLPGNFEYDDGPGHWRSGAEKLKSGAAAEFQSEVSGKPKGWIYWLGKKWDAAKTGVKELIDAKSASGDDFYVRAILDANSSLGRAFRNSGSYQAEIKNLQTMHEIATKHGYTAVIEAETAQVARAFRALVADAKLTGKVTVRVH
jgi:hypothetical protein